MSILFERVGRTNIFSINTRLKTLSGLLQFNQVIIGNASKNLVQGATNILLHGKKIFTKTTNQINEKTTIIKESWRSPIQGLRNGIFRLTKLNNRVTRVTGIIDGKRIRPYLIICNSQGCISPDQLFFQNGAPVRLTINPRLLRAMQLVALKAQREVHAFFNRQNIQKKSSLSQENKDCLLKCYMAYHQCIAGCDFTTPSCADCDDDFLSCKSPCSQPFS